MAKLSTSASTDAARKSVAHGRVRSNETERVAFWAPATLKRLEDYAASPQTISRRGLVATAISGAMAWLGGYIPVLTVPGGRNYNIDGYTELIALCSELRCPRTIGKACLLALPAPETTRSSLARTILADVMLAGGSHSSPHLLARAVRKQSRADFREGKVVTVDGWILSLTETRAYALAALLPEPRVPAA